MDGFSKEPTPRNTLLAFLDESGNPDLQCIDRDFPVFVAATVLSERDQYWRRIVPAVYAFREKHCGGSVILHSRDIRRQQGAFAFLVDRTRRASFYAGLNALMEDMPVYLIGTGVHMLRHLERYGANAFEPYQWALTLTMERLLMFARLRGAPCVHLIAEARTPTLDHHLRASFNHTLAHGTRYHPAAEFGRIKWVLTFRAKRQDIIGTQLADLVGYPIARHVLDPERSHPSLAILRPKFITDRDGREVGLKIVP
jgi:hypothetical protein